ncbi:MAG: MFS transporter [Victivallales bacterium]|jgi:UMF1 family MFS transporter|nr:MFS transporter [Victivallales bacterium]
MHLTRAQLSWISYDMANAGFALIVRTVYAPLFFKQYSAVGMNETFATGIWGYVSAGAGLAAGILAPWLGSVADANSERKRYLSLFLCLGLAATIGLCFTGRGDAYIMLAIYFIALVSYMAGNSFYDALLPSVSTRGGSDKLSSLAYAWGYIGGVIPFLICLAISLSMKDSPVEAFRFAFITTALWWGVLSLPLFRLVRERKRKNSLKINPFDGFRQLYRTACEVKKHRNALLFLVAYFLYIDGVGTILLMATPISVDIGIPANYLLLTILALQFLAFPFTILYGKLSHRFGARKMLYVAIGVYVVIALLVGLIAYIDDPGAKRGVFIFAAFLIGTSQGGIQSLSRSFFMRLIPASQAAEFFGFYNIFGKFTTVLGPVLVGVSGWLFNSSELGIALLAVPFLLGATLLAKVKLPTEPKELRHV